MVHLDVKPNNILYSGKDLRYKFCDLGTSQSINEEIQGFSGTPFFMR